MAEKLSKNKIREKYEFRTMVSSYKLANGAHGYSSVLSIFVYACICLTPSPWCSFYQPFHSQCGVRDVRTRETAAIVSAARPAAEVEPNCDRLPPVHLPFLVAKMKSVSMMLLVVAVCAILCVASVEQ